MGAVDFPNVWRLYSGVIPKGYVMLRKLLVLAVILGSFVLATNPVRASSLPVSFSYLGGGVCAPTSVSVPVHIETNFPSVTPFTQVFKINGAQVGTASGSQSAGFQSYNGNLGFGGYPAQSFPYTYQMIATFAGSSGGTVTLTAVCNSNGGEPIVTIDSAAAFWNPGDDRVNRDPGQPAALYCRSGGVQVWSIDGSSSKGTLALTVTASEIAQVKNSKPAQNTLIKASADGSLRLFYLPGSDELSFVTTLSNGKPYSFIWKGCS